ncbi:MAG: hypothetical protein JWL90_2031 [Chthoniobacteraceae bacterium]|nr:hypothetical protein [Chthoniobacteraceae bacterium]
MKLVPPLITASVAFLALACTAITQAAIITSVTDPLAGGKLTSTSIFTVGGVGTATGVNDWPAAELPSKIFDVDQATKYLNFAKTDTGIAVTPAFGLSIATGINFTTANDGQARNPATFSLYGSNTVTVAGNEAAGATFSLSSFTPIAVDQPTGFTSTTPIFTSASVSFPNTTPYKSYILVFPTVADVANSNSMQVAQANITGTAAVPEPGTLGLLGLTTVGIAALRRRRH